MAQCKLMQFIQSFDDVHNLLTHSSFTVYLFRRGMLRLL